MSATQRHRIDNPADFGRVAVVMGGSSTERSVSLDSGRNVLAALQARGIDAHAVDGLGKAQVAREAAQIALALDALGERFRDLLELLGFLFAARSLFGSAHDIARDRDRPRSRLPGAMRMTCRLPGVVWLIFCTLAGVRVTFRRPGAVRLAFGGPGAVWATLRLPGAVRMVFRAPGAVGQECQVEAECGGGRQEPVRHRVGLLAGHDVEPHGSPVP